MRSKRAKWSFCVLAVLLNLGGGPMAWAHAFAGGKCHESQAPAAMTTSQDCPQHHAGKPAHSLPCCEGGSCACTIAHSIATTALVARPLAAIEADTPELRLSAAPSAFIDDSLRPPIG
jgi:hypothetical protein